MKFPWKIVFEYIRDKLTVYIRKSAQYQKSDEQWEQKTNEQIHEFVIRAGKLFQTIYHGTVYFDRQLKNNRIEESSDLNPPR